ncbi:Putative C6 zinc finger domain protein [[Torrubiella] hemipterigena]|uniref:Putative C6 zinc finger domain protein n=1 Tax=[Torrubiella] hemipterigena TaxID=1531966 RepID=A0A0A1SV16_9HYPO|nr:Putative C6 zinc finger domain protein [[Torrubiella] hemipterigena]
MSGHLLHASAVPKARRGVKTGCVTCRKRKIKCDEAKPACQKCTASGRTCDGYDSMFRFVGVAAPSVSPAGTSAVQESRENSVSARDIERLNKDFSTKTLFHSVSLNCAEEAQQILQTSLTDPNVRQAVASLRKLRQSIETSQDVTAGDAPSPGYDVGIRLYCTALGGLASKLSSSGIEQSEIKSALLCCEMFISIEQSRGNFSAMAQHIMGGLRIMHEQRARPGFGDQVAGEQSFIPAQWPVLPLLDIFVIKLFAAPCKYADLVAAGVSVKVTPSDVPATQHARKLVPNMKAQLTKIAESVISFLNQVSQLQSAAAAPELLLEKRNILASLVEWATATNLIEKETQPIGNELLSLQFAQLLYGILQIIVLSALNSSAQLYEQLQDEINKVQRMAALVTAGVAEFRTRNDDTIKARG